MAGTTADIARWTGGAGDGAWASASNWAVQAGTPSTPPAADEKALFDHRGAGNLNGSDQSSLTLGEIEIANFPGQIGTDGVPMQVSAAALKVRTSGRVNLSGTFPTIRADAAGKLNLATGDCNNMTISGGEVLVGESFTLAKDGSEKVIVLGGNVTINYNASAIVEIDQQGGTVKSFRSVTTFGAKGGTSYVLNASASTTVNIEGGATYNWLSSGTQGTVNLRRGRISNLGSPFAGTITTLNRYQTGTTKDLDMNLATVSTENPIGAPGGAGGLGA